MDIHLDIPYPAATSPRQALDLFLPHGSTDASPLLVYIHGGAWRSESKSDFTNTLLPALARHSNLPVAAVEYRLAPNDPHPAQALDTLAGLSLLSSSSPLSPAEDTTSLRWNRKALYLIGHSAGAFIAASLVLDPPSSQPRSFAPPPSSVRQAIKGIICVDGIYDLPSLLEEYPSYDSFVNDAFGRVPAYLAAESPARRELSAAPAVRTRWLVLHSREDELLSLKQPEVFVGKLKALLGGDETKGTLDVDYEQLKGGHEQLLRGEEILKAVSSWVERAEAEA